jgi:hypothetical protein
MKNALPSKPADVVVDGHRLLPRRRAPLHQVVARSWVRRAAKKQEQS